MTDDATARWVQETVERLHRATWWWSLGHCLVVAAGLCEAFDRGRRFCARDTDVADVKYRSYGRTAAPLLEGDDALAWLRRWRPLLTRPLRHPGNHRYAWSLVDERPTYGPRRAYPKRLVMGGVAA